MTLGGDLLMSSSVDERAWSFGVIKWVKESYGFIECSSYLEDLFYHQSSTLHTLKPMDRVQFRVVHNPITVNTFLPGFPSVRTKNFDQITFESAGQAQCHIYLSYRQCNQLPFADAKVR